MPYTGLVLFYITLGMLSSLDLNRASSSTIVSALSANQSAQENDTVSAGLTVVIPDSLTEDGSMSWEEDFVSETNSTTERPTEKEACNISETPGTKDNCTGYDVSNGKSNNESTDTGSGQSSGRRSSRSKDGYLTKSEYEYYKSIIDPIRFSLHAITLPLLFLTTVAFALDRDTNISNKFIVALNAFALASNVANVVFYTMKYTLGSTDESYVIAVLSCNYIIICCRRVVYILNFLLSTQRLLAVTTPMKSRLGVVKTTRYMVFLGIPLVIFVFHIYVTLMHIPKNIGNNMYVMSRSEIYEENNAVFNNLGYFAKTVFSYIPLAFTLAANLALLYVLKQHNEKVKKLRTSRDDTDRSRQDRQMTIMIMVSTLTYTIMSLPPNINQMVGTFVEYYNTQKAEHYLFSVIKTGVNGSQTLGDLTNFFCYLALSSSFRTQLAMTVLPGRSRKESRSSHYSVGSDVKTKPSVVSSDRSSTSSSTNLAKGGE